MSFQKCNNSSFIQGIQYNKKAQVLHIKMNQKWYKWRGVPHFIATEFIYSPSRGKFFNEFIKGKYPFYF